MLPEKLQQAWSAEKLRQENSPEHVAWLERQWKNDLRIAAWLHTHHVAMLAGSDSLDVMTFPGPSLHRELQRLVEIGMTPAEALRAATSDAARFLGKEGDTGSIEVGKAADLVVLNANPLDDIANTRKIALVVLHGAALAQ